MSTRIRRAAASPNPGAALRPSVRALPVWPASMLAAALLTPDGAFAQSTNPVLLPEVVVSAPRRAAPVRAPATRVVVTPPPAPEPLIPPTTPLAERPAGETVTTIDRERLKNTPLFSVADLLQESPGISIKQGNGPRDFGISIRGSNARNGFAIKNIVVLEDGFPVTQPDGLSRTDLTDPHAYGAVDVFRGPSSALFGNYAIGGAVNFRLRRGGEINGAEYGVEAGSFNYLNNYVTVGGKGPKLEVSIFASDVRGDGYVPNSSFNTQTFNFLGIYTPTPNDTFTLKVINNVLFANLPLRLSLNQFNQNPFQHGCVIAAGAAAGCGTVNLFANGFGGATVPQTAEQVGFNRDDRRSIVGARWEHNFDNDTVWRSQFVYDDRNINQPTGTTSAIGDFPSVNLITDITRKASLFGFEATHMVGAYLNTMSWSSDTINVRPGSNAPLGRISSNVDGQHTNMGVRAREEIRFTDQWSAIAGIAVEHSMLKGVTTLYNYNGAGIATNSLINADRDFLNTAPEVALIYKPNSEWQVRGRVATAYGTPQVGNLFVTPAGVAGNNTQLDTQKDLGFDLGVDWTPTRDLKLSVTGFYEFFRNELVTQSPGVGLQSFTFNAPASEHRGIEAAADWRFAPGWRLTAAYTYNDQFFTEFTEQLTSGATTSRFNRADNKIPGVSPNEALARLGYDQPSGPFQGLGGFVEYQWKDSFFVDNGNLLKVPGYELVNVNVHYNKDITHDHLKGVTFFFEVRNLFDKTYIASANNISNSINAGNGLQNPGAILANSTGSIYAGPPRTFVAGMRLAFR